MRNTDRQRKVVVYKRINQTARHSGAGQNPAVLSNMPLRFVPRVAVECFHWTRFRPAPERRIFTGVLNGALSADLDAEIKMRMIIRI